MAHHFKYIEVAVSVEDPTIEVELDSSGNGKIETYVDNNPTLSKYKEWRIEKRLKIEDK